MPIRPCHILNILSKYHGVSGRNPSCVERHCSCGNGRQSIWNLLARALTNSLILNPYRPSVIGKVFLIRCRSGRASAEAVRRHSVRLLYMFLYKPKSSVKQVNGRDKTLDSWTSVILARSYPSASFAPSLTPEFRQTRPKIWRQSRQIHCLLLFPHLLVLDAVRAVKVGANFIAAAGAF